MDRDESARLGVGTDCTHFVQRPRRLIRRHPRWPHGRCAGSLLRETASRWSRHKASLLGAAIAYYSVFSLGPLMVIAIAIAGFVFGDASARGEVNTQLKSLLGDTGAQAVEAMLAGADRHHNGLVAATIGVGTLLFASIWIVVALKEALNTIWEVVAAAFGGDVVLREGYLVSLAACWRWAFC